MLEKYKIKYYFSRKFTVLSAQNISSIIQIPGQELTLSFMAGK
jgi:hypothetical protein